MTRLLLLLLLLLLMLLVPVPVQLQVLVLVMLLPLQLMQLMLPRHLRGEDSRCCASDMELLLLPCVPFRHASCSSVPAPSHVH